MAREFQLTDEMRAKVASMGLQEAIHLPGVTNAAWQVLSAMDLFVLASRMEGLPNVMVEDQACGVMAVLWRSGGASPALQPLELQQWGDLDLFGRRLSHLP